MVGNSWPKDSRLLYSDWRYSPGSSWCSRCSCVISFAGFGINAYRYYSPTSWGSGSGAGEIEQLPDGLLPVLYLSH